jgi:hypothetical protein
MSEFLNDEVGSLVFFECFFDFWEAMEMWLFQLLIGLYLVLNECIFILGIALEYIGGSIFFFAAL